MLENQTMELTAPVREWLSAFERLSLEEQLLAAKEIQKRFENSLQSADRALADEEELDMSPMSAEEMTFLADRLFQMYDEEERQHGCP